MPFFISATSLTTGKLKTKTEENVVKVMPFVGRHKEEKLWQMCTD